MLIVENENRIISTLIETVEILSFLSVSKIKEAIAKGEYPIDLDAVADMLLDAFKEMKS